MTNSTDEALIDRYRAENRRQLRQIEFLIARIDDAGLICDFSRRDQAKYKIIKASAEIVRRSWGAMPIEARPTREPAA